MEDFETATDVIRVNNMYVFYVYIKLWVTILVQYQHFDWSSG